MSSKASADGGKHGGEGTKAGAKSGAVAGAAAGFYIGGPAGAALGGAIGMLVGAVGGATAGAQAETEQDAVNHGLFAGAVCAPSAIALLVFADKATGHNVEDRMNVQHCGNQVNFIGTTNGEQVARQVKREERNHPGARVVAGSGRHGGPNGSSYYPEDDEREPAFFQEDEANMGRAAVYDMGNAVHRFAYRRNKDCSDQIMMNAHCYSASNTECRSGCAS